MPRNSPDKKVRNFRRGQPLKERQLNSIVEGINRGIIGVNAPRQPNPHGKGGGSPLHIFYFVLDQGDYLVCEDSASPANEFLVAKPYELRRTPFDGQTVAGVDYTYVSNSERDADDGVDQETQFITPDYVSGHEIYAIKPQGGTGVTDDSSPAQAVEYLEVNQGRAWAAEEGGSP